MLAGMDVAPVDPRDTKWEVSLPAYRVFIWTRSPAADEVPANARGWSCTESDVTNADVAEVLTWAQKSTPRDGRYTVYVRTTDNDEPGLLRLAGWDPTRNDPPPPHVR